MTIRSFASRFFVSRSGKSDTSPLRCEALARQRQQVKGVQNDNQEFRVEILRKSVREDRHFSAYATKHKCSGKQFFPSRKKKNKRLQCVILSDARVDNPAKNLKSYLCVEILREKEQEAGLRMTIRSFASRFFVSRSGKSDTSPLRCEALARQRQQVKGVQNDNQGFRVEILRKSVKKVWLRMTKSGSCVEILWLRGYTVCNCIREKNTDNLPSAH